MRAAVLLSLLLAGCVHGEPVGPMGCWTEHRYVWVVGDTVSQAEIVVVCDR